VFFGRKYPADYFMTRAAFWYHFSVFYGIFETVFWTFFKNLGIDNQRIVAF
jgi:hypothetical protein